MRPDLTYLDGKVPRVDVLHLHHGVWVNLSRPNTTNNLPELFFAAGEEKTIFQLPKGYGYRYEASDNWLLNHMIHNLTPIAKEVKMVYEIDFIPDTAPAAKKIKPARPIWMDVESGKIYPIFNVEKNSGKKNIFTYPNDDPNAYPAGRQRNAWTVDRDGVLLATAGHLHPGGLHTDLWLRARRREGARGQLRQGCKRPRPRRSAVPSRRAARGDKVHLFQSKAKYYEPAGAVSWDVAMTATRPDWKVKVKKGDVLTTTATYGTKRAAWWESMGIMVAYMADEAPGSKNPYRTRVDLPGKPTHGHLRENRNHGGKKTNLPDARKLKDGALNPGSVDILGFNYRLGDLRLPGQGGLPPVVTPGQSLTFVNQDDPQRIYHSLTSCKAPCNKSTGIAYPIADGPVQFESGTLGTDRPITTGGSNSFTTPKNLKAGTYTYFCRIHPFMRGAFRVKK